MHTPTDVDDVILLVAWIVPFPSLEVGTFYFGRFCVLSVCVRDRLHYS